MNDIALSEAVARPAHVTDESFFDFDMFNDPGLLQDPHARLLELHKQAPPIFWTPRNSGHWMLIGHKANFEASRDPEMFSNNMLSEEVITAYEAMMPPGSPRFPRARPITVDPPLHGIYRGPLQKAFSPKSMAALQGKIRALAAELIDAIKPLGKVNFMPTVAEPLPVQVFLEIFGLPLERQKAYRALVKEYLDNMAGGEQLKGPVMMLKVAAIMRDTLLERKENRKDDVISLLWNSKLDDLDGKEARDTNLDDLEDYSVLLFIAGLDTVMNGIGLGVVHLAKNPELQRQLRENPKLIPEATEEMLRRYTFTVPPRIIGKDGEFQGVEFKKGDKVMLCLPAADLDGNEFPNPEAYNAKRDNNVHIAFGVGPHRCLGSHLARIELNILYEELLARLPEFRLDPTKPLHYHGGAVIGPDAVHLEWAV